MEISLQQVIWKCSCIFPHGFSPHRKVYTSRRLKSTGKTETRTEKRSVKLLSIHLSINLVCVCIYVCVFMASMRGVASTYTHTHSTHINIKIINYNKLPNPSYKINISLKEIQIFDPYFDPKKQ